MRMWIGASLVGLLLGTSWAVRADTGGDTGEADTGANDTGEQQTDSGDTGAEDTGGLDELEDPGIPLTQWVDEADGYSCADAASILLLLPWAAWRRRRLL